MKEHVQDYGVRRWAGDDLVELQSEPLEAIQKLVEPYAPCILQGCEVNAEKKQIEPGMVALWEVDENNQKKRVKIARFEGCVTQSFPVYLTLKCTPEERVYVDGKNKPIAYDYTAQNTTVENDVKDMFPLKITAEGGPRLSESLTVNFTAATERENIQPNETIGTAFGKIRKWFSDLKDLAFKEKVAKSDFDADLTTAFNNKVDNTVAGMNGAINLLGESSATPQDNDFYISQYANGGTSNKTYLRRRMSALWAYIKGKLSSDTGVNISGNATSATKATQDSAGQRIDTTYIKGLGINGKVITYTKGNGTTGTITTQDTTYNEATFTSAGLLSAADKKKINLLSNHQQVFTSYAVRADSHGTYGFVPVGDKWVSNNYGVNNGVAETTWKIYSLTAQTVTFKYRVISEASYDKFTITVNGTVAVNNASGQGNETTLSVTLNAGENTLVAKYAKDGSNNSHFDCAYLWFGAVYTHPTDAGNKHIPAGGSSGQYLKYSSAGTAVWGSPSSDVASTTKAGFMSAADKKKVDGAYIYYMANVECSTTEGTPKEAYNPDSVQASFSVGKDSSGLYKCSVNVKIPSGYSYAKALILGQSNGAAWISGNSGKGIFEVYIMNTNRYDLITNSTFTIVMIAHN